MDFQEHRLSLGKFIIFANIGIFILVFVLYAFGGFLPEDLEEILKYLIPIKSTYMALVTKFVITDRKTKASQSAQPISSAYRSISRLVVFSHISLLAGLIILRAFSGITFEMLIYSIVIIETFFGAFLGIVINDMFQVDNKNA